MNAKDAIKHVVEFCDTLVRMYVEDLKDDELFVRSVPNSNHIAWSLGHLVSSACHMLKELGHPVPSLPSGFAEAHTNESAGSDNPAKFYPKDQYLRLLDQVKTATLTAVDATPDAALDQPGPASMREYAPTVGSVLMLLGTHNLMHAGQFVPIRRKLGRAPLF